MAINDNNTARVIQFPGPMPDIERFGFSPRSVDFRATTMVESLRFQDMDRWQKYYECAQHDWKRYDFDGRMIRVGPQTSQPLLSSERAPWYVPLRMRRPSTPYRMARKIVNAFTNLVLGEGRWPDFLVAGDKDAQDFVAGLIEESKLATKAILARNMGGSNGTVGLSWCFHEGSPNVDVHNGKNIYVHEWKNKTKCRPKHVTECYKFRKDWWDPVKKGFSRDFFWYRRDWTETANVIFREVKVQGSVEPPWQVDEEQSKLHDDGFCHFVWIQNIPTPDEGVDGSADCMGIWDGMDTIDVLMSILARGGVLNLDPTLLMRMDPEVLDMAFVRKGSDNSLVVGKDGDARYLELQGSSITAGLTLAKEIRSQALEVAECVIPDPNTIAAAGTSAVALKMIYAPMLGKCDVIRDQYGDGIKEILRQMLVVAQRMYKTSELRTELDPETGEEVLVDVTKFVELPPKVVTTPILDDAGAETGEETIELHPRTPGVGTNLEVSWGPYFKPTSADKSAIAMMLAQATGAKAFCSTRTAVEVFAAEIGKEPGKVWDEMMGDRKNESAQRAAMLGGAFVEPGSPVSPIADSEGVPEPEGPPA